MARKTSQPKDYVRPEDSRYHHFVNIIGSYLVDGFHLIGLFAIGAATIWAAFHSFFEIFHKEYASIQDILLLFIYLEIGAMVGIYFKTNHLPVRYLIYIAMTALTRHVVEFVTSHHKPEIDLLIAAGAIFVLALSILVVRFGSSNFPSVGSRRGRRKKDDPTLMENETA